MTALLSPSRLRWMVTLGVLAMANCRANDVVLFEQESVDAAHADANCGDTDCGDTDCGDTDCADADRADAGCASNQDCPGSWYCSKATCATSLGQCTPEPVVCDESGLDPVCGCDGVTYWNDCVRRESGIASSAAGECGTSAIACSSSDDCDAGASCARLLGPNDSCAQASQGSCWVLPQVCPQPNPDAQAASDPPRWQRCGDAQAGDAFATSDGGALGLAWSGDHHPADSSTGSLAEDTCNAIRDGVPFRRAF